jgi:hypothetical protein
MGLIGNPLSALGWRRLIKRMNRQSGRKATLLVWTPLSNFSIRTQRGGSTYENKGCRRPIQQRTRHQVAKRLHWPGSSTEGFKNIPQWTGNLKSPPKERTSEGAVPKNRCRQPVKRRNPSLGHKALCQSNIVFERTSSFGWCQ